MTFARLAIPALALTLAAPLAARAAAVAPAKTSDLVTLLSAGNVCGVIGVAVDTRNLPDGTAQTDFTIPAKTALVITEIEVIISDATPSRVAVATVSLDDQATLVLASAIADADGTATATLVLPSGTVAGAGKKVCLGASTGTVIGAVHGFLTKAK